MHKNKIMKDNNDTKDFSFGGSTPQEIDEIYKYLDELNEPKVEPDQKLTDGGFLDYNKYMENMKINNQATISEVYYGEPVNQEDISKKDKELEKVDKNMENLNKSAPIAEDSIKFEFKMLPIDKIVELSEKEQKEKHKLMKEETDNVRSNWDSQFYIKTKHNQDKKLNKVVEFSPGDRVGLKPYIRNIYNIPPNIFQFGGYIIDIIANFLPNGQASKIYRLEEFIPVGFNLAPGFNKQYLEFEIIEGYDDIKYCLEIYDENTEIKKKNLAKVLGVNSVGSIRGTSSDPGYYYEPKSFMPVYNDEEYAEMAKKVEKEYKSYWGKLKEQKPRGHPMTNMFKRD